MRKAGLALQSPVRCFSGCFSSHFEFKSHLIPAPLLPPAPARLQSGAVSGWPGGRGAGRRRRAVSQQHLPAQWEPLPRALGGSGLRQPLCVLGVHPRNGSVASQESAVVLGGGQARDALSPDPFCPASTKLSLAVGSGTTSKARASDLSEFCIPFLPSRSPKSLFFSPVALCGVAEDEHAERWVTPAVTYPILGGHWGSPGVCLWG